MKRFLLVTLLVTSLVSLANYSYSYPGSCSPATDYLSCISCAGEMYDQCYANCGWSFVCKNECGQMLRADYADCRQNFEPIYY